MSGSHVLWNASSTQTGTVLKVYLYPDNSSQDNECENSIADSLAYAGQQLIDYGAIDGYAVYLNYSHPNLPGDNSYDYNDNFESWRVNNHNEVGVHVGVKGSFSGGRADAGECSGCTGFTGPVDAVVGTGTAKEFFRNAAIQEVLHPCIRSGLISTVTNDHQLGEVTYWNVVTPMATGYESSEAGKGTCNASYPRAGFTRSLTNCTKDAVKTTATEEL